MRRILAALILGTSTAASFSATAAVEECNPLGLTSCSLPFPSNHFTIENPDNSTGLQVSLASDVILSQQVLNSGELPQAVLPEQLANHFDGFSPAAPIMFEIDRTVSNQQLVNNGQAGVMVFDLTTGEQIPVRVGIKSLNRKASQTTSQFIEVYPISRFPFGHQIVAVLTQQLLDQTQPLQVADGVSQLISQWQAGDAATGDNQALDLLQSQGVVPSDIVSLTRFTVASEQSITGPMLDLGQQILADRGRIRNLKVNYANLGAIAAKVRGEVLLSEYRTNEGHIDFQTPQYRQNWAKFELLLPREAEQESVPLIVYGHGLGVPRETRFVSSEVNLKKGIAVLSISHPNHGDRSNTDGGFIFSILNIEQLPRILGMAHQSPLDFLATWHAAKTIISGNDWLPQDRSLSSRLKNNGINIPDIDPQKIYYMGTSLGGVFGSTFVSMADDLKGAWLQVAGVGVSNILMHSSLFYGVGFSKVIPDSATEEDLALFQSYLQLLLDPGDGINFVHRLQTLPGNMQYRPLGLQVGIADDVVFNASSHAMSLLTGIPQTGEVLQSWQGVPYMSDLDNGSGVVQVPSLLEGLPLEDTVAHMSFIHPTARRWFYKWQSDIILND